MGKKKNDKRGVVFSTNPDFEYQEDNLESDETLSPSNQKLLVKIDRKQRKGKEVTLVEGFIGHPDDLEDLGKLLKTKCGTGGSAKEGIILIQGDKRDKIIEVLKKEGYNCKRGN
ncbi:MAG: translation initiation factor 1 [Limisphaerales bacterium]|jgi:translation initiation factor 1